MTDTQRPTPATMAASAYTSDKTHLPAGSFGRVTPKTRARAAERGEAMEDGSFPIRDGADLRRAIAAFGRAKDKASAKRHIIKRARALDKIDLLPESWRELASRQFTSKPIREPAPILAGVIPVASLRTIEAKVALHNKVNPGRTLSVAKAKCVYNRGVSALLAAAVPGVTPDQQGQARLNAFLYLLANGEPRNPAYIEDNDLLAGPPPFPRASSQ